MPNKSPIQRKSINISIGVNNTNKAQLRKINKATLDKHLPQVPLTDLYMRVDKKWNYKGKSCRLCGVLVNDPIVIDKHRYVCEVLNKNTDDDMPRRVEVGNRVYYTYKK